MSPTQSPIFLAANGASNGATNEVATGTEAIISSSFIAGSIAASHTGSAMKAAKKRN